MSLGKTLVTISKNGGNDHTVIESRNCCGMDDNSLLDSLRDTLKEAYTKEYLKSIIAHQSSNLIILKDGKLIIHMVNAYNFGI